MTLLALLLALFAQDDEFKTLIDRAKRSDEKARKAAAAACAAKGAQSAMHFVAAKFLEKGEAQWKLDPKDPGAAAFEAYLQKYWVTGALGEKEHREAFGALQQAIEKNPRTAALEAIRHFQLAHLAMLGDDAADLFRKLGWKKEGDRWGKADGAAAYAVFRALESPLDAPADSVKAARATTLFGPRYLAAVLDVHRAFAANANYENAARSVANVKAEVAPASVAVHLKASFDSIKAAVYCRQCTDGKLGCDQCLGKKKVDLTCETCHGLGWSQKPNSYANVLQRCPECKGNQIFKNQPCPTCKGAGKMNCWVCGGKPWQDGFKGCKDCKTCATCKGRKETATECSNCGGKGRSGGVNPQLQIPTLLCDTCKGKAILREACKDCGQSGLADCATCAGKGPRDGKSPARPKLADVWEQAPCAACAGKGWPMPNLAIWCEKCFGLGAMLKPKTDPKKVLD